jgi:hypothetical protein
MRPIRQEPLDPRIIECWRAGMHSAVDIGRHIGIHHRHVAHRIARLRRAGAWPFAETPGGSAELAIPPARPATVLHLTPAPEVPPPREAARTLTLRIPEPLYARLRRYCRRTGATVSETLAGALNGLFAGAADEGRGWTPAAPPASPSSGRRSSGSG